MRTTEYEGNVWLSVDTVVDPLVKNEIRRWHVYLNGTYMWTKHTVERYTDEGLRSGSITEGVDPINDYAGKYTPLPDGAVEYCDSCTGEITEASIAVDVGDYVWVYCLECGEDKGEWGELSDDNCWDCGVNAEEEFIDYGICIDCRHSVCTDCQGDLHRNGRRDDNARCGTSTRVL